MPRARKRKSQRRWESQSLAGRRNHCLYGGGAALPEARTSSSSSEADQALARNRNEHRTNKSTQTVRLGRNPASVVQENGKYGTITDQSTTISKCMQILDAHTNCRITTLYRQAWVGDASSPNPFQREWELYTFGRGEQCYYIGIDSYYSYVICKILLSILLSFGIY